MDNQVMERHMNGSEKVVIVQKRKGCFQECLGCEHEDFFDIYKNDEKTKFATAKEDAGFCWRYWCSPNHKFTINMKEEGTGAEMMSFHHPFVCCASCCSCCCFQKMTMKMGGKEIGKMEDQAYCCVPRFQVTDEKGKGVYKVHQPTCVGGMCVNICYDGLCNCKTAFQVFPHDQKDTDNGAKHIGEIMKKPRSLATELFSDAAIFDVTMPNGATTEQKGLLIGTALFLNSAFFEDKGNDDLD